MTEKDREEKDRHEGWLSKPPDANSSHAHRYAHWYERQKAEEERKKNEERGRAAGENSNPFEGLFSKPSPSAPRKTVQYIPEQEKTGFYRDHDGRLRIPGTITLEGYLFIAVCIIALPFAGPPIISFCWKVLIGALH